jgi:hypothetical protein
MKGMQKKCRRKHRVSHVSQKYISISKNILMILNVINLNPSQHVDTYANQQRKAEIMRWREERALSIVEQSKKYKFAVRFWPGIYDNIVHRSVNITRAFKKIVQYAKDNKLKTVAIAEDDAVFTSPGAWQYYLDNIPDEFDIYSGGIYSGQLDGDRIVNGYSGNTLITVHERFYDFFLSANEDPKGLAMAHLDQWLGNFAFEKKYIVCLPFVVKQIGGYSENTKRIKPLETYEQSWNYFIG